jgi:hypothetical protein
LFDKFLNKMLDNGESDAADCREGQDMEEAIWIGEELRRRRLPQELAAMFAGHGRDESAAAMNAVQESVRGMVEDGVRKRISGAAPVVGEMRNARHDLMRRAFGLRR